MSGLAIFDWIMQTFRQPCLGAAPIVERAARDGREGLAVLSQDERFRHVLAWAWDAARPILFARMLNPSTARAFADDQTMKKLFGFARLNGYGGVVVINHSDYRATDPGAAKAAGWPTTGYAKQLERRVLNEMMPGEERRDLLLAWGNHGPTIAAWAQGRVIDDRVRLIHFGLTKTGRPEHPCMLPYARPLMEFAA